METEALVQQIVAALSESPNGMLRVSALSSLLKWGPRHKKRRGKLVKFLKKQRVFKVLRHESDRQDLAVALAHVDEQAARRTMVTNIVVAHTTREYKELARKVCGRFWCDCLTFHAPDCWWFRSLLLLV